MKEGVPCESSVVEEKNHAEAKMIKCLKVMKKSQMGMILKGGGVPCESSEVEKHRNWDD